MPTLDQRIDKESVSVAFLPLPKGKKRGSGMSFAGGDPVAQFESAGATPPFRWVNGKPEPIGYQNIKNINARGGSEDQLAGFWYTPKQDERALVWTLGAEGILAGSDLHPPGWQKSVAMACGGGQQVGYGYQRFAKDPQRALLWSGSPESMVVLTSPDPDRETTCHAVDGSVQGGRVNLGGPDVHACLWRGTSDSFVDLHPDGMLSSELFGIGDGEQVGWTMDKEWQTYAALWTGSAKSHVNLAPKGFKRSQAQAAARGFQVGWIAKLEQGMLTRAVVWNGSAGDYLDLQDFLPEPWNVSSAMDLHVDGDRLRIIGSATQAAKSGGYEVNNGQVPVVWEMKLKIAEPKTKSVQTPRAVTEPAQKPEPSPERAIDRVVEEFARAVIGQDFKTARDRLAPWLQKSFTGPKLKAYIKEHLLEDTPPADYAASGNDTNLEDLRGFDEHQIPEAVTVANFRQWIWLDFTPGEDSGSQLDYLLRLWLIVVELDGLMKIGFLEAEY